MASHHRIAYLSSMSFATHLSFVVALAASPVLAHTHSSSAAMLGGDDSISVHTIDNGTTEEIRRNTGTEDLQVVIRVQQNSTDKNGYVIVRNSQGTAIDTKPLGANENASVTLPSGAYLEVVDNDASSATSTTDDHSGDLVVTMEIN